jgi:hypothetical protein
MSLCFGELELLSVNHVFHPFHSKFEMPIYMKVVSLDKLDNFRISPALVFKRGLTVSLTKG